MSHSEVRYITFMEAIAIHNYIMERTGQDPAPLRDAGLLEAAVVRPRQVALYEGADLIRQCALLAVAISQSQAFLDGNKRTVYATADLFLRRNGWFYAGDPVGLSQQLETVAEHSDDLDAATTLFEDWMRTYACPL